MCGFLSKLRGAGDGMTNFVTMNRQIPTLFRTLKTRRQDPAMSTPEKTPLHCQLNGQKGPLLRNCNIFIIEKSNRSPLTKSPEMYFEQRANYILDCHLRLPNAAFRTRRTPVERRSKPRSNDVLPARVWGVDIDDQPFSYDCHLDNISASGLFLRLPRRMKFSSSISLVVRLLNGPIDGMVAAIKGTVTREELKSDGHRGIGIRITEHKFI
jgi:Tfp pilus assembly protein PilZ